MEASSTATVLAASRSEASASSDRALTSFDFKGATEDAARFRKTAVAFEDLAVAAYKGQAPLIQSRALLVPALTIR
jgi:hypothetical protein